MFSVKFYVRFITVFKIFSHYQSLLQKEGLYVQYFIYCFDIFEIKITDDP